MPDLTQAYTKMLNTWFDAVDAGCDLFLKNPLFTQALGRVLWLSSLARARKAEAHARLLGDLPVATAEDLDRAAAETHRLEAKINELVLQLEEAQARVATPRETSGQAGTGPIGPPGGGTGTETGTARKAAPKRKKP
jgi:HAMP domain-containing protein